MKKILFIGICCLCLCGCESNEYNDELIGIWSYNREPESYEGGWGDFKDYEFKSNGEVEYFECLHMTMSLNSDEACTNGSSVWIGNYKLKDNIIILSDFTLDKTNSYNPTNKLDGPENKLIADFDNMYLCDRNAGLDCEKKYEKDTNE